jgi:hypothetical protein
VAGEFSPGNLDRLEGTSLTNDGVEASWEEV